MRERLGLWLNERASFADLIGAAVVVAVLAWLIARFGW